MKINGIEFTTDELDAWAATREYPSVSNKLEDNFAIRLGKKILTVILMAKDNNEPEHATEG